MTSDTAGSSSSARQSIQTLLLEELKAKPQAATAEPGCAQLASHAFLFFKRTADMQNKRDRMTGKKTKQKNPTKWRSSGPFGLCDG